MKKLLFILAILTCTVHIYAQCTPGATIRVGTTCTCNTCSEVTVMSLESYTGTGLNDEWIPSWGTESLKAGAVAYRSYGAYYINNPYNGTYDLANTTCKQVWQPSSSTSCVAAATATSSQVLTIGVGGPIARSEYAAETNGFGCGDGFTGCTTCGTPAWPCISDAVCAGTTSAGHWRGMCQWGSQRWAQAGQTYTWILNHYYNPANIFICTGSVGCSPTAGNDFCYGPPAPQTLSVGINCHPVNGTTCGATASIMTTSGSCSNSGINNNVRDVWYSFTASGPTQTIELKSGANFNAVFEVYSTVCSTATLIGSCINATGTGGVESIVSGSFIPGNTYYVRVYDYNENANTSMAEGSTFTICIHDALTGDVASINDKEIEIRPNPGSGAYIISGISENTTLTLTNSMGIQIPIAIQKNSSTEFEFNISAMPPGVYILSIFNNEGTIRKKLIKQ